MDKKVLLKFKEKVKQTERHRQDPRFLKTIRFLEGKGLLKTNLNLKPLKTGRVDINDALWAGENVEPRILEVIPAAILHFPKTFVGEEDAPKKFIKILEDIRKNKKDGADYEGIPFEKLKFWANQKLTDGRTKPENQKGILTSFRLKPSVLKTLETAVDSGKFKDKTEALEFLVEKNLGLD